LSGNTASLTGNPVSLVAPPVSVTCSLLQNHSLRHCTENFKGVLLDLLIDTV
jgi:hypothetical protein